MSGFIEAIPLALYVHIPWCVRKCPYCDFNSHELKNDIPEQDYVAALLRDLEQDLPLVWGRRISSVFIGGGTPSLFSGGAMQALISGIQARLPIAPGTEITLEANPGTADAGHFSGYRDAGINRLSMGAQSFDDRALQAIGRIHDAAQIEAAFRLARDAGFDNINLDLMFGLPGQDLAAAQRDLEKAIDLAPEHLSHYQLTLEPNTAFHHQPPVLPADDQLWEMQAACQQRLAGAGYGQYEISAYATENRRCRHNLNYWEYGDYLGIGAGAHGKLTLMNEGRILRLSKKRHPREYLASAEKGEFVFSQQSLDPAELPLEFMMNSLRLIDGVPRALYQQRTGLDWSSVAAAWQGGVERGLLAEQQDRIRPTEQGHRYLNELLMLF